MSRMNVWIALLLISVLINGVLIGAGARNWLTDATPPPPQAGEGPQRGFDVRAFIQALPEEARADARRRAMAERRALRDEFRNVGRARRAAYETINTEPFDPEAASAALADVRSARAAIESRTEAMILDIAAGLTEEQRRVALNAALRPLREARSGPGELRRSGSEQRPDGPSGR
jgi:uncharacterized membrane protein